ncbi:MAG: hypothetical protein P4L42_14400 [Desulfocapsaceae bacterium]|nr:hypothetical protein [Desulfocapsaceae bacterium]
MLKETVEAGLRLKAIKMRQLERIKVEMTVQGKDIRFPTDTISK